MDKRRQEGLTLLEIIVVLFIMSITTLIVFPLISNESSIRSDTRIVSSTLKYLFDTSLTTKQACTLKVIFREKKLSYNCQNEAREFKIGSLVLVSMPSRGEISDGELLIEFKAPDYESLTFLLYDGKQTQTIRLNGVSGRITVHE